MSFENGHILWQDYAEGITLRPGGEPAVFSFACDPKEDRRYRLMAVGGTEQFYQWKDEPDEPFQYHMLCDALDTVHARKERFCLNMSSKAPEEYIRRAYKKVLWPPMLSYLPMSPVAEDWTAGIWVNTAGVKVLEGGYLRMRLDIYGTHEGVSRRSVALPPDEQIILDLPRETDGWVKIETRLRLPEEETAHVGVWIEGVRYAGEVYLEHPFLCADGQNLLPGFDMPVPGKEKFDWTAQNLSRREWPEFAVSLNGEEIFRGAVFERCHVDSDWSIPLPAARLEKKDRLEIRLTSDWHDPMPYTLHELILTEQAGGDPALIAAEEIGSVEKGAHILLKTEKDDAYVRFESLDGLLEGQSVYHFEKAGLHGVHLTCREAGGGARFRFSADGHSVEGTVRRIVRRAEDGVVTGTGDMIYVPQERDAMEEYLSWYVSGGVGNLLTIRPTYRWCGSRVLNADVWRELARVLNELDISYVLMADGRELPGENCNPDDAMLAGKGYLGRQGHECDGAMYYWGDLSGSDTMATEQENDMAQEIYREDAAHCSPGYSPNGYICHEDSIARFRDPRTPRDYKGAMEASVKQLDLMRGSAARHTGPSVMFKYLAQAGYTWLGAETMYGSMEPLMAFLRGAGTPDPGVHHAVQWSSSPHDTIEHFRRYRLALYVSYMQGASVINTEEGLWHMEEYYSHYHRFSAGCAGHLKQQQDFFRYVASHSRQGRFHTPVALLQGRYDGWHGFGNRQPWGWTERDVGTAEKSWDLLKVIYPNSRPGEALYLHGCDTDHAVGYHTGMPMGNVDVIPAEADAAKLGGYGLLAFMGYHCAEKEDFLRLAEFVRGGGDLLLTRAHMNAQTDAEKVARGELTDVWDHPLAFTAGEPIYVTGHVNGQPIPVCEDPIPADTVLACTDEGIPLVTRYQLGKGTVTLFGARVYPADPAIRPLYEQALRELMAARVAKEPVWTETGDDMGSSVYALEDGSRHVYFTPVDWFRKEDRKRGAVLRVGGDRYTVSLPFGVMTKCVVRDGLAAWPHSEEAEVLDVSAEGATVQGAGVVTFTLARSGQAREVCVDLGAGSVRVIPF